MEGESGNKIIISILETGVLLCDAEAQSGGGMQGQLTPEVPASQDLQSCATKLKSLQPQKK